jgi:purine nucleosidase
MKNVILDTDIGTDVDDALALAFAAASSEISLLGVTTVHANAALRARIARRLLDLAGAIDVPVVAGRSAPLRASAVERFHWHELWGHEGVGVLDSDALATVEDDALRDDAAAFIVEQVNAAPGEVSLIAVGPLTNVGRAFELDPSLGSKVKDITLMGGLVDSSDFFWGPQFETNFNADPGAAEIVLSSGAPITVVPLEVTLKVFLDRAQRDRLDSPEANVIASALGRLIEAMREPFLAFNEKYGLDGSEFDERTYMHDPLAVYTAIGGPLVSVRDAALRVAYDGDGALLTVEGGEGAVPMRLAYAADGPAFAAEWLETVEGAFVRA